MRADVLDASLVHYSPDGEGTFTTYGGGLAPDEFTPKIRVRLRVHDGDEGPGAFETTGEWRVPSLRLSAVTAGRWPSSSIRTAPPTGPVRGGR